MSGIVYSVGVLRYIKVNCSCETIEAASRGEQKAKLAPYPFAAAGNRTAVITILLMLRTKSSKPSLVDLRGEDAALGQMKIVRELRSLQTRSNSLTPEKHMLVTDHDYFDYPEVFCGTLALRTLR